jgi:preprotein translocase subunit Sec63
LNKALALNFVMIAFAWVLCYQCYNVVKDVEPLQGFVPHEILGVNPDSEMSVIKKAYR